MSALEKAGTFVRVWHRWGPSGKKIGTIRCLSSANESVDQNRRLSDLDNKWSKRWREVSPDNSLHPTKHLINNSDAPTFYALSMFPYPSGMLHLGHLRVYTISDVVARLKRLKGYKVLHPMGWDAFGLPAENAAIERGVNPAVWTEENIKKMKSQMGLMMADFDWDREVSTCSPDYYKWTQKIFISLYEKRLAYRKEAEINWDPVDQTVLANEQVDFMGRSWRSGAQVEKKKLEQWFIGITEYAKDLNKDMEVLDKWPDKVKSMQRHWIGESHGTDITIFTTDQSFPELKIFTSRPETLFSVQFVALSVDHPLVSKLAQEDSNLREFVRYSKAETDVDTTKGYLLKNVKASIPISVDGEKCINYTLPLYAAPYVLGTYGHGSVMGCPAHDERDYIFWKTHNQSVPPLQTVGPSNIEESHELPYVDKKGKMYTNKHLNNGVGSLGKIEGMSTKNASSEVISLLEKEGLGSMTTKYRLRDWLISRQRYWGVPIPMIFCENCGTVPVPDEDLPVTLPKVEGEKFGKHNLLNHLDSFIHTECPKCHSSAKRDTDTMDTFMDSSWYFFRYTDPKNTELPFDKKKANALMPVDMYIGGVEHAILHLLYSRFISKFLADAGYWDNPELNNEPIKQLVTQGMVHGKTYTDPKSGRFLRKDEIDFKDPKNPSIIESGLAPEITYEKMSKSKHNGADPASCIKKYGADATRAHMLFQAPISDTLNWNEEQIAGTERWLRRVINLGSKIQAYVPKEQANKNAYHTVVENVEINGVMYDKKRLSEAEVSLFNSIQEYAARVSKSVEEDLSFNTIISDYMKFTNKIEAALKSSEKVDPELLFDAYKKLLIIMSPVTPCVSEECWESLLLKSGKKWKSIFFEKYPESQKVIISKSKYNVFINGKPRAVLFQEPDFFEQPENSVIEKLNESSAISKLLLGKDIKKLIRKPGLISIVTS
ncbi:Piso0_000754 [Millerozyma farinosa CBS 7064]|uniref:leucine--tRNA ligase n=1 Tax=Pichia sorbitophila (strain ATCC MYA-4447 / BCRC 22081 / CBS 7064 / NBRC 10061 / NRRL Y-12695) TaxID=559304 RepID=G8YRF2_PICSO|nr:Piso0_000754 [Millerozyma farinosa CBS 7064]